MRSFSVELPFLGAGGDVLGKIEIYASDDGKKLTLEILNGPLSGASFSGFGSYFWVLSEVREQLEKLGYLLASKGAQRNVFPGGLLGETSLGLIAYEFDDRGKVIGRLNIFDALEPHEYANVVRFSEQKEAQKNRVKNRRGRKMP